MSSFNTKSLYEVKPSAISYSKYQFNCKNCDYVCLSKSKGSIKLRIKLHEKKCGREGGSGAEEAYKKLLKDVASGKKTM